MPLKRNVESHKSRWHHACRVVPIPHPVFLVIAPAALSMVLTAALTARNEANLQPRAAIGPEERGVNVRAFGATGNGVVDDGPAMQAAIREALARKDEVYLPP